MILTKDAPLGDAFCKPRASGDDPVVRPAENVSSL